MKLLLDTHVALWALYDISKMPSEILKTLSSPGNEIYYSLASAWEIEIKHGKGKIAVSSNEFMDDCDKAGFYVLPIKKKHIAGLENICFRDGHKDPFDKLLVSQSFKEKMEFLSADAKILDYLEERKRALHDNG